MKKDIDNRESPWTIKETCEYLKIGKSTLYRFINEGEIKPCRIGRSVRFNPDKIRKFAYKNDVD